MTETLTETTNKNTLLAVLGRELAAALDKPNPLLLVGFSGGRDSLALLVGLAELGEGEMCGRYHLVAAHFNHNLRGAEAERDEEFCREFCKTHSIEYVAKRGENLHPDMPNLEQEAREARYAWFAKLKKSYEDRGFSPYLVTAHHREDQAETLLLHLLRGSGTRGLAAMRPVGGWHLRPLLGLGRAVLQGTLDEMGLVWCEDSTNECVDYRRNLLRIELMPKLLAINPEVAASLAQTAQLAAEENDYFDSVVAEKMRAATVEGGLICYDWVKLSQEPMAIRRRLVRALWQKTTGVAVCPLSFGQVDRVLRLKAGQSLNLSGAVWAARRQKRLVMKAPTAEELARRRIISQKGKNKGEKSG